MCTLQRIINLLEKVYPSIRVYVICLILSNGRKNCADMARLLGISPKPLYAYLSNAKEHSDEIENILIATANETKNPGVKRTLVIDPTMLIKRYACLIENLCYDRAGCTKHVERGLVPVYASVVDKNVEIPICIDFWIQKNVIGKKRYKSKVEIAQALISYLRNKGLLFDFVSLDGAFPTQDMLSFLNKNEFKFIIRIPKSRCIIYNGKRMQLQKCPALKLMRNSREKTIRAKLPDGTSYFFTVQKRERKGGGWETIFLISNMDLPAKEQVAAFNLRWPQEIINRTTKQKFGSTQCQALEASKQEAHIMAGFLAYTIIKVSQNDKKKKGVDKIVNVLRNNHFGDLAALIPSYKEKKCAYRFDSVEELLQIEIQNLLKNIDQFNPLRL